MKSCGRIEGQFSDGAIDECAGGIAISQAPRWHSGDAKATMDYWAQITVD